MIESVVLSLEEGRYGVDIPKGVWHKLESLESGSVVFECKEGPFVPHEVDGILELPKKWKSIWTPSGSFAHMYLFRKDGLKII